MPSDFYIFSATTTEEILTLINGLHSKQPCGHDDIPERFEIVKMLTGTSTLKCYKRMPM